MNDVTHDVSGLGHSDVHLFDLNTRGETDQCVHGSVQITVLGLGFGYGSD